MDNVTNELNVVFKTGRHARWIPDLELPAHCESVGWNSTCALRGNPAK